MARLDIRVDSRTRFSRTVTDSVVAAVLSAAADEPKPKPKPVKAAPVKPVKAQNRPAPQQKPVPEKDLTSDESEPT